MNKGKKKKSGGKKSGGGGGGKGFGAALKSLQQNAFNYAGSITPGKQSPQRVVDGESLGIAIPDYAGDGIVSFRPGLEGGRRWSGKSGGIFHAGKPLIMASDQCPSNGQLRNDWILGAMGLLAAAISFSCYCTRDF